MKEKRQKGGKRVKERNRKEKGDDTKEGNPAIVENI